MSFYMIVKDIEGEGLSPLHFEHPDGRHSVIVFSTQERARYYLDHGYDMPEPARIKEFSHFELLVWLWVQRKEGRIQLVGYDSVQFEMGEPLFEPADSLLAKLERDHATEEKARRRSDRKN
jgi:hypothetical protein